MIPSVSRKWPARRGALGLLAAVAATLTPGCFALRPRDRDAAIGEARAALDGSKAAESPGSARAPGPPPLPPISPGVTGSVDPAVARTSAAMPTVPAEAPMGPSIPPPSTYPIDLPSALRLAESINPVIGEARTRIDEAMARQQQARVILVPNLNAGGDYDAHAGVLQRSTGQILNVDRQSLYFGGGAGTSASGTIAVPAVNIAAHLGDAIFEPLAARQQVNVARLDSSATANAVLLGVAVEYLELQAAGALLEARRRTEAEAAEVARIAANYARTGEGRQADADRAATQRQLRRADVRRAEERLAVASARLSRRLHLDPSARIEPASRPIEVFSLIEPDARAEDLIEVARHRRPEIGARSAAVGVAETRTRQEKTRPFLPTLWVGFSGGAFGGGSNLVPPLLGEFRGRTDFDAVAYWSLLNFGKGNLAYIKRRQTQLGAAVAARDQVINLVREEVSSARAEALAGRARIRIAVEQLASTQEGFEKDFERIRGAAGPPLEVLNNLDLLGKAREALVESVLGYNRAQFRLFVAMGSPPPLDLPTQPAAPPEAIESLAAVSSPAPGEKDEAREAGDDPAVAVAEGQRDTPGGSLRDGFESLERARQASNRASADYDRLQADLLKSLAREGKTPSREDLVRGMAALAEAHRAELNANVEYDRSLWKLMADPKPKPESTDPGARRASNPPGR